MYNNIKVLAVIDDVFFNDFALYYAKEIEKYADIIWYRIKTRDSFYYDKIKNMRKNINNCPLVLSSDYITALKYGYNGVHINIKDLYNLNKILESDKLLTGFSSHNISEINNINVDYYTLSPIYHTPKEYKVKPLGLIDYNKNKKVYALGGINLDNMEETSCHFYGVAGIRLIKDMVEKLNF